MGTWGTGLYDNDFALDVKDQLEEYLEAGESIEEVTARLKEDFLSFADESACEQALFWTALADAQHSRGMLLPEVRENALAWIEKGCDLELWANENPEMLPQRRETLQGLRDKLSSPPPKPKKARKSRAFQCEWNLGDVYAYRLESALAKEKDLYGRYFLIQKVDEASWLKSIVPIVYVKLTRDDILPKNAAEYDALEFVQMGFTKYEDRFLPIDMQRPKEDIEEKSKLTYEVDEYGYLPEFRAMIICKSKKAIPAKLIYVGNFPDATRPQKEFVPHVAFNFKQTAWKNLGETFEEYMIKRYCNHNRRELAVYHT